MLTGAPQALEDDSTPGCSPRGGEGETHGVDVEIREAFAVDQEEGVDGVELEVQARGPIACRDAPQWLSVWRHAVANRLFKM
jgi:hypothetical protein